MSGGALRLVADGVLRRSPAQFACRLRSTRRLAVLAYHGVDDPEQFRRQLDFLVARAAPVSLDDVLAALDGGAPLPPAAVLISFDDGHRSVLAEGLPLLRERGVPAVAFVIPGLLDTRDPFWWSEAEMLHAAGARAPGAPAMSAGQLVARLKQVPDTRRLEVLAVLRGQAADLDTTTPQLTRSELHDLVAGGVAVGNHTWSHPCLDQCTNDEVERQVRQAHDALAGSLGSPPVAFAYPNGNHDVRAENLLRSLGYRAGFLFDHRLAPRPERLTAPLRISRLRVGSNTSLDRLATIVSGLHPAVHRLRGGR